MLADGLELTYPTFFLPGDSHRTYNLPYSTCCETFSILQHEAAGNSKPRKPFREGRFKLANEPSLDRCFDERPFSYEPKGEAGGKYDGDARNE